MVGVGGDEKQRAQIWGGKKKKKGCEGILGGVGCRMKVIYS